MSDEDLAVQYTHPPDLGEGHIELPACPIAKSDDFASDDFRVLQRPHQASTDGRRCGPRSRGLPPCGIQWLGRAFWGLPKPARA